MKNEHLKYSLLLRLKREFRRKYVSEWVSVYFVSWCMSEHDETHYLKLWSMVWKSNKCSGSSLCVAGVYLAPFAWRINPLLPVMNIYIPIQCSLNLMNLPHSENDVYLFEQYIYKCFLGTRIQFISIIHSTFLIKFKLNL